MTKPTDRRCNGDGAFAGRVVDSVICNRHRPNTAKFTQPAIVLPVGDRDAVVLRLGKAVLRSVAERNPK